jgi:cytochrome P450 family 110
MSALPKGPKSLFLQTVSLLATSMDPFEATEELGKKYGDPFTFPSFDGPIVVTWEPEWIKAILSADPDIYAATAPEAMDFFLGQGSLLRMEGPRHKRARKLLAPPFHGERMRAYGALMRDITLRWASRWEAGKAFPFLDATQGITLDVIIEAVFGVQGEERVRRFHEEILGTINALSPALVALKPLRRDFFGLGPWTKFQRTFGGLQALVAEEMAAHRASPEGRVDILTLLLTAKDEEGNPLSDEEIQDQLRTLVMAGHETTATSLAWACYELLRNPEVLAKLQSELAALGKDPSPEAIARLPYLQAICEETLRLYPIAIFLTRRLKKAFQLKGYEVPAGANVAACIYLAHRRPESFPEPDRFQPERFLGKSYPPAEYLPFGGGARRCVGAAFAMYEMKIVLGTLFGNYRLRLAEEKPVKPELRAVTIGPKGGVRVVLEGRA